MRSSKLIIIITGIFTGLLSCEKDKLIEQEELNLETHLVVSSDTIVFVDTEKKKLVLSTEPASETDFEILATPDWVEVTPNSGTINNNEIQVSINSNFKNMNPGFYRDELIIGSSFGNKTVILEGSLNEHFAYTITDSIKFPFYRDTEHILIQNQGNLRINYTLSSASPTIELSTKSGEIAPGDENQILASLNRGLLEEEIHSNNIYVTINEVHDTITVNIGGFEDGMYYFDEKPIDAEYSKNTDRLVYITENSSLYIYNPLTNGTESIILPSIPTCISVSRDGSKAVIGHDSSISYVDLASKEIINTIEVSCKAADIVLGSNGWAYVFPENRLDYYKDLRISCLNLNVPDPDEKFHLGWPIGENQRAKLHPSGDFIFSSTTHLDPLSITKFDIKEGVAKELHSVSTDRVDSFVDNGGLWISEDGIHLFTPDRDIFKTSDNQDQSLEFTGTLNLKSYTTHDLPLIQGLDHSSYNSNIYVILTGPGSWEYHQDPNILVYDSNSMNFKNKIKLKQHYVRNYLDEFELSNARPLFIFSSSKSSEVYVVTEGFYSSNSEYKWAIQNIKVE